MKIINYFKNLPTGVKLLISINLVVYLTAVLIDLIFSININKYLGVYATVDSRFNLYQIVTSFFSHDLFFTHILTNLIIFLVFSPSIENRFGTLNLMLLYFLSGFIAFICSNNILCNNYFELLSNYGKISHDVIADMDFNSKMGYNFSAGSSGCISGILGAYLIINFLNIKKIIYTVIILFLIITNILALRLNIDNLLIASVYNHLAGFVTGSCLAICLYFIKDKLQIVLEK